MNSEWDPGNLFKFFQFITNEIMPIFIGFLLSLPLVFLSVFVTNEWIKFLLFTPLGIWLYVLVSIEKQRRQNDFELMKSLNYFIKKHWKRSLIVTFLFILLECMFMLNVSFYNNVNQGWVSLFFIILSIILIIYFCYFVMIDAQFQFRTIDMFKIITYLIFTKPRNLIVILSYLIITFYLIVKLPNTMLFLIIFAVFYLMIKGNKNLIDYTYKNFTEEGIHE